MEGITNRTEIARIFAQDQINQANKGVIGYDNSPEALAQAKELSNRIHSEFCEKLKA